MRAPTRITVRAIVWLAVCCAAGPDLVRAQRTNPLDGDADAARRGALLYRARCAGCHGLDARGISGPDLTAVLAGGATDDRLFRTIRSGVPGTGMPRFNAELSPDTQLWEILAYLRMLTTGGSTVVNRGDAVKGARVFLANCASCHWVNGRGGRLGPELSRVGSARSASSLAAKVREPGRTVVPGFEAVVLVMSDGRRVSGIKKNEDAFSIQIMDMQERLQGFAKSDVREVVRGQRSPMPASGASRIGDAELEDLVAYLLTLRRPEAGAIR